MGISGFERSTAGVPGNAFPMMSAMTDIDLPVELVPPSFCEKTRIDLVHAQIFAEDIRLSFSECFQGALSAPCRGAIEFAATRIHQLVSITKHNCGVWFHSTFFRREISF